MNKPELKTRKYLDWGEVEVWMRRQYPKEWTPETVRNFWKGDGQGWFVRNGAYLDVDEAYEEGFRDQEHQTRVNQLFKEFNQYALNGSLTFLVAW